MTLARRIAVALVSGPLLAACAGSGARPARLPSAARAPGHLFIVGGGPQPQPLVRRFVELAGGSGGARIVVFGMASETGREGGEEKARDLRALGAAARSVFVDRAQADLDSVARLLDDATGVWFLGGDQSRLTAALGGTKVERAIRDRYRAGAVIGGTSAGAAVMSAVMLTGDERHPGGARPPSDSTEGFLTIARGNVVTAPGFGLLTDAIVDQHFLRRRRHNRLLSVVLEDAPHLGVGIDESTALEVEPDGLWRVHGESAVVIYDARHARMTPALAAALGATGVILHVLPAGSTYDPRTGVARLPGSAAP